MPQALLIDIPDEVFAHLRQIADRRGQTPEVLASEMVTRHLGEFDDDPLLNWLGAFDSGVADATDRHDDSIGRALSDEMKGDAGA